MYSTFFYVLMTMGVMAFLSILDYTVEMLIDYFLLFQ